MPFSSPAQLAHLAISVPQYFRRSPFNIGDQVYVQSVGAATLYGADHPGSLSTTKYARITGTARAADATWDLPSTMNAMDSQAAAGLTVANRMRVCALINGVIQLRKGSDENPGAGEFIQTDTNTIGFGSAIGVNDVVEVFVFDAADITQITGGAFTAFRLYQDRAYTFMVAGVAVVNMTPVPH